MVNSNFICGENAIKEVAYKKFKMWECGKTEPQLICKSEYSLLKSESWY